LPPHSTTPTRDKQSVEIRHLALKLQADRSLAEQGFALIEGQTTGNIRFCRAGLKGMNAVIEASADFLRRKGARADSAEIQKELVRSGVLADGPRDRSRITSYLGRAKAVFDNVRGEGYGLREWRTPSA
jgi:hypothetical protein